MNKLITSIVLVSTVLCQGEWLPGTAYTLPKGRWEIGLFRPVRWGQDDNREISFFKLTSFLMPNLTVKQKWNKKNEWTISTLHSFYYPTPLLRKLQSPFGMDAGEPNMFALISPEFEIPHMVSFGNSIVVSTQIKNKAILTIKAGFVFALSGTSLSETSTIDLPLIYHRLGVYYNGWMVRLGTDLNGKIVEKWSYLSDVDVFLIPGLKGSYSLENKGMLTWAKSQHFNISFGYKMVAGLYPDGYPNEKKPRFHVLPFFDLQWCKE